MKEIIYLELGFKQRPTYEAGAVLLGAQAKLASPTDIIILFNLEEESASKFK